MGRGWDSKNPFNRCPVNVIWWHQTKLEQEKACKRTWWEARLEEKHSLQAEQSTTLQQHVPFCMSALSAGGQAKRVNSAYQRRFINIFSLLPQMLSGAQVCPRGVQETNICSAEWAVCHKQGMLWQCSDESLGPHVPPGMWQKWEGKVRELDSHMLSSFHFHSRGNQGAGSLNNDQPKMLLNP